MSDTAPDGRQIALQALETLNRRGRVECAILRVTADGEAVYEGPSEAEAQQHWEQLLAAPPPQKKQRTRKRKVSDGN